MREIIQTAGLTKNFGRVKAVSGVDLLVGPGEIYGFLGLNGAGKTTTIRMLLGLIHPSRGGVFLRGQSVSKAPRDLWNRVGYLVEIPYAYPDLTVMENLEAIRRLRGLTDRGAVDLVVRRLGLEPYRERRARNLSLGNAQRLGLAKALIHRPEILILDEPSNGLDPAGIVEIRELLIDLARNQGVTVFVSSHLLGEISRMADRIGIIHQGRMLEETSVGEMDRARHRKLRIQTSHPDRAVGLLCAAGYPFEKEGGFLETVDPRALGLPQEINRLLVAQGCLPSLIRMDEEDLEDYFLRRIGMPGDMP